MRKLMAVAALVVMTGCFTYREEARRAAEAQGMTDVRTGGVSWFGCSKGDKFGAEFTATNPAGRPVDGVVCCGVLKGCTVRW